MKGDPFALWNFNSDLNVSLNPELNTADEGGSEAANTAIECTVDTFIFPPKDAAQSKHLFKFHFLSLLI